MVLQTWGDVIVSSLQQVWASVANFVPLLIGAIIVFLIGWIVAVAVGKVVEQIVKALRVDGLLKQLEVDRFLQRGGWRLNSGAFIGALVKWFLIIVFLLAAVNILGLGQVSSFLRDVVLYLPNVIVAAFILIIAAMVSNVVERAVRGTLDAAGYRGSFVGVVVRWSIWVFAIIAALFQLGIATTLLQTLVTGFVAVLVLGFGLAFGLGGRDAAASFLDKVRADLKK